jgi:hypothetical protein
MTTSQHRVVTTALASLFYKTSDVESHRRKFVAVQLIRYATQAVAKINTLSNLLMSLFVMDLVHNDQPIPLRLSHMNHTMWNWAMFLCTTSNGKSKPHSLEKTNVKTRKKRIKAEPESITGPLTTLQEKGKRKRRVEEDSKSERAMKRAKKNKNKLPVSEEEGQRRLDQNELIEAAAQQEMVITEQQKMFLQMKRVFDTQLKPQFPGDFEWPDRHGLDDLLIRERQKRVVNFKLAYGQTFLSRQQKVVRHQINELATFTALVLDKAKRKYIRHLCTRLAVARINRWSLMTNFDSLWLKHAGDQDSAPMIAELDSLVDQHQIGFGTSPLVSESYRLSEDDAGTYPSAYVHYFSYLKSL